MAEEDAFPFKRLSDKLKFWLERDVITCKAALKDLDVALREEAYKDYHAEFRAHKAYFERRLPRLKRAIRYVLRRRERERG
ncbi:hypothetical protein HYPGJ_31624 [Hyphomicrobium sp. GJ21]|uniref:hypothetical protein n=1 Tax=Hyphomicrobium sp. GJ21 TaxID=113574 RepID=UPI000622BC19|nr:hypothetical protein [Hyphomicrobium sp. GJ21]CEJ88144.1 hypothetical protein HYPGJ_31624 [Hyphomicrobium sp. GJ21]